MNVQFNGIIGVNYWMCMIGTLERAKVERERDKKSIIVFRLNQLEISFQYFVFVIILYGSYAMFVCRDYNSAKQLISLTYNKM